MEAAETDAPEGVIETKRVTVSGLTEGLRKKDLARQRLKLERQGWTLEEYHDAGMGGSCAIFSRPMAAVPATPQRRLKKRHVLVGLLAAAGIFGYVQSGKPVAAPKAPSGVADPATVPQPARGMGIPRDKISALFDEIGFAQKEGEPEFGQPKWIGKAQAAVSYIIGPSAEITSTGIMAFISKDDEKVNTVSMLQIAALLGTVFPGWKEGLEWLSKGLDNDGGTLVRDGKQIELTLDRSIGWVRLDIRGVQ